MAASATKKHSSARSRRRGFLRRSRIEWAVRGGLALLVAVLGYYGVAFSLAQVICRYEPERAHKLAPYDGRLTAQLAAKFSGIQATADADRSVALAELALRQDPTAVAAVSALGINAQLRGDTVGARRLFSEAEKLSRRDIITQLWLIEDAVGRGDIKGALRHYDIALRVKPQLSEQLYPTLSKASAQPAIRTNLIHTLAARPAWTDSFVSYTATNGTDPRATAALLVALQRARIPVPALAGAGAIDALVAGNLFDQAWSYYARIRPDVDRRRSRDPRFTAQIETPTLFDWIPTNDGSVANAIDKGSFEFSAPASIGGPLLRQLQLLPPGNYRLSGHSRDMQQAEDARPYWVLSCYKGRELGRLAMTNSSQANGAFTGTFIVPADCPAQELILVARPSEAVEGLSGSIDLVELAPIR